MKPKNHSKKINFLFFREVIEKLKSIYVVCFLLPIIKNVGLISLLPIDKLNA
jgi:hypothetical protein